MGRTLVLGASLKPGRYSNLAVNRLKYKGEEVLAFGKQAGEIQGVKVLNEWTDFKEIDTITMYLNAENQQEFYSRIIYMQPRRVIFNPGSENPELYDLLRENNIPYENACTLVLLSTDQY